MTPPKDIAFDPHKVITGALKGSKAVKGYFKGKSKSTVPRKRS
ncbi:MAG: hypothetical protein ACTTJS_01475 [Wolinella sp.]